MESNQPKTTPKKNGIRALINRDDGAFFQAGNRKLNRLEIIGYLILLVAFLSFVAYSKAGIGEQWFGWVLCLAGLIVAAIGTARGQEHGKTPNK